jgi:hypothetical protein
MTRDLARYKLEMLIVVNTSNDVVIIVSNVLSEASAKINVTSTKVTVSSAYLASSLNCLKGRIPSTSGEKYVIPIKVLATIPAVTAPYSPGI